CVYSFASLSLRKPARPNRGTWNFLSLFRLFGFSSMALCMHVGHPQHVAEVAKAAPDAVEVRRNANDFKTLVAARRFEPGECVLQLNGRIVSAPTRTSIEL